MLKNILRKILEDIKISLDFDSDEKGFTSVLDVWLQTSLKLHGRQKSQQWTQRDTELRRARPVAAFEGLGNPHLTDCYETVIFVLEEAP